MPMGQLYFSRVLDVYKRQDISGVSCKEGEVTEGVFEKYRIATYKEASWKPYIIAAMILSRKYAKPGALLEQLLKEAQERVK